jgi:uncharacterized protein (TIGR00296 family)
MFTLEDGTKAVHFARDVIDHYVQGKTLPQSNLPNSFNEHQGAFVTLHTYPHHDLRGCIGIPTPIMPLKQALVEAAKSTTHDPRFPDLQIDELEGVIVEVSILSKPELIKTDKPQELPKHITIGHDGLIVEQGMFKGLLLPQVPIEQHWNKEEFLSHACMKAGLTPDAWFDRHTKVYKFSGQVFKETKPHGDIEENKLDGSSC